MPARTDRVHTVTAKLKDGTIRTYRYHRVTRRMIHNEPGGKAYIAEVAWAANPSRGVKKAPPTKIGSKTTHGFVYFVAADDAGLVKIGWATNVDRRLRSMQSGSPLQLRLLGSLAGAPQDERRLQAMFAHLHARGEWFVMTDEIAAFIAEL